MLATFLKHYFITKFRSFRSKEKLLKWQNKRVISHLQWVINNSSYYKNLYKDLDLAAIPAEQFCLGK